MVLYHATGRAMVISPALWRQALAVARDSGWRPAGTLPPPASLEAPGENWHGSYEPAEGQEVMRADARGLGQALEQGLAVPGGAERGLAELAEFCRAGGFLVCPSPGNTDALLMLAAHTGSAAPVVEQTGQQAAGRRSPTTAS